MCNSKSLYDPAGFMGGGGDQLHAKMGIGVKPQVPDVVTRDPEAEAAAAKIEASKAANASTAQRRRSAKGASLSLLRTGSGQSSSAGGSTLLAQGKAQLGA